jgi:hypothetical protein
LIGTSQIAVSATIIVSFISKRTYLGLGSKGGCRKWLPLNYAYILLFLRIIEARFREVSAKMPKQPKVVKKTEKAIDTYSKKRSRGRPQKIPRAWVTGRAFNSRIGLSQVWPKLCDPLLAAQTEDQIIAAFENHGQPYSGDYVRQAPDILALIRDPSFPKRPKAQIGFLADSLAGRPSVEFRTSRDICVRERARERAKSPHKILRKEFYIECSCGYEGPARDNACRSCSAEISTIPEAMWGDLESFR